MKTYIGVKIVQAAPLALGAYNERRGWPMPADENPARPGYFLTYPDGYVSWSPAEIFEGTYRLVSDDERALVTGTPAVTETFFDRLVAERAQLDDRYTKLSNFLCTAQYEEMPRVEQNDLANQANVMLSYRNILDARISRNAPKPAFVDPEIRTTARHFDEDGVRTLGDDKSEEPVPFK